jgi:peptide/nickel transport system permease protein
MSTRLPPYWYTKLLSFCGLFLTVGFLPHVIPGAPLALYESWPSHPQQRAFLIKEYGLDHSVPVQYTIWLRRTVTGHWGHSRFYNRPVFPEVLQATGFTLALLLWVLLVCLVSVVGLWGVHRLLSSPRRTHIRTNCLTIATVFPNFLIAIVLHDVVIWQFGWFRIANPLNFQLSYILNPAAMLLPACVLAISPILVWYSGSQGSQQRPTSTSGEHWQRFCQLFHPLLASFILEVLLVEYVMALPGLGRLGIEALKRRDFPLLQGFIFGGGMLYLVLCLVFEVGAGFGKRTAVQAAQYRALPEPPQSARLGLYGGMWGLALLLVLATCTAQLQPYDPTEIHRFDQLLQPGYRYVLGTDFLGRDVLSRTLQGFRSALPRIFLLTILTGSVAWAMQWIAHRVKKPYQIAGNSLLALFNAMPPLLLAFMIFLVVEHRPRPLEITLALAGLPIAAQLMAYPLSLARQCATLAYLVAHLLLLELTFFFLNLSPESLTPTWGSDIRLGMHYNHLNMWLVIAPALAFTWSRYIFHHLSLYTAVRTAYDAQMMSE